MYLLKIGRKILYKVFSKTMNGLIAQPHYSIMKPSSFYESQVLLDSSRGHPVHLTVDLVENLCKNSSSYTLPGIQIHHEQLMESPIFSHKAPAFFKNETQPPTNSNNHPQVSLTLRNLTSSGSHSLWLGFRPISLINSSFAENPKNNKLSTYFLSIRTDAGVIKTTVNDIILDIKQLLPNAYIIPCDPSLISYYYMKEKSKNANDSVDSFFPRKTISPTPLFSFFQNLSMNIRRKFLIRYKESVNNTFTAIIDPIIKNKPEEVKIFVTLSSLWVDMDDFYSAEESLLSSLKKEINIRDSFVDGYVIQIENDKNELLEMKNLLPYTLSIIEKIKDSLITPNQNVKPIYVRFRYFPEIYSLQSLLSILDSGVKIVEGSFITDAANAGRAFLVHPTARSDDSGSDSLNLNEDIHRTDQGPLSNSCSCSTCNLGKSRNYYSRAYIHHLLKSKEMLAQILLSIHNYHSLWEYMKQFSVTNTVVDSYSVPPR